ncbi:MAG: response regulator transcription factor [Acidimicrobiaceae bacterium]|nr:response regulator transcription factor [Acidimicrobiaceae bacterium]
MSKILVVDDELHITELLQMGLSYNGFDVTTATSGRSALQVLDSERPDLLVLDVMMADLDGFELARRIRQSEGSRPKLPIIFLTAKDATADKISGLGLGADDYVTKPFSVGELIARIRAVLRRTDAATQRNTTLSILDLEIDEATMEVRRDGRVIELTPTEYRLLHYLVANQRAVLTKVQILEHIWEYDFDANASVLETYISYLRRKVDFKEPRLIKTIRGIGYSVRAPQEE